MRKRPQTARLALVIGTSVVIAASSLTAIVETALARSDGTVRLANSAAPVARTSVESRLVPGSRQLTIDVWMAYRDQAAQRFVNGASTPGSPSYRRFLSPNAYTRRFGASPARTSAVRAFLLARGFSRVSASVNNDYVSATGSVTTIDRAFSVQMRQYENRGASGGRGSVEANDRELSITRSVRSSILAITGLDGSSAPRSAAPATPDAVPAEAGSDGRCSRYWGQRTAEVDPAFDGISRATVPVCGYTAGQMRSAYGLNASDTGAGRTIAIIQVGSPDHMLQTLTRYAKTNRLPAPQRGQYREVHVGGTRAGACVNGSLEEAALDSEGLYAMAPRARQIMVDGDDCDPGIAADQELLDAELEPITGHGSRPEVNIESVSYDFADGVDEQTAPRAALLADHAVMLRAAAEGVSVLECAGDRPGIEPPDSDPDVTTVGGTTLGIGADGQRLFETGWSTVFGERTGTTGAWSNEGILLGGSGGTSTLSRQPAYQRRVVPASLARGGHGESERTVPDISADSDPYSGMLLDLTITGRSGSESRSTFRQAGTSLATPLIAGMIADAEESRRADLGFLNPLLYRYAGTSAYNDILSLRRADPQTNRAFATDSETEIHGRFRPGYVVGINDDQQQRGTSQVTLPGYDTTTGLGSPDGQAFLDDLRSQVH